MESYLLDTVKRYCDMVPEQIGKNVNLSTKEKIPTPFLPEDNKEAPAGRPLCEQPCVTCPHCMASFTVWGDKEKPPWGVGKHTDGLSEVKQMAFGSPISPSPDELPKLTSEDIKARAIDIDEWYPDFMNNGPKKVKRKAPHCVAHCYR